MLAVIVAIADGNVDGTDGADYLSTPTSLSSDEMMVVPSQWFSECFFRESGSPVRSTKPHETSAGTWLIVRRAYTAPVVGSHEPPTARTRSLAKP
jgi:hypothetical protein